MAGTIEVRLHEKAMLTVKEAAAYSNICLHRIQELCKQSDCSFVVKNGNRFLIKRQEFDEWIRELKEI